MTANAATHDTTTAHDDEIDFRALLRQLWNGKKTIMLAAVVASAFAVWYGYFTTTYVSTGVLQTHVFHPAKDGTKEKKSETDNDDIRLTAYNYRKYADLLASKQNFKAYLDRTKDLPETVTPLLNDLASSEQALKKLFSPVFMVNDKDQKQWGVKLDPAYVGQLFGVAISTSFKEPNHGQVINFLESYARDAIARTTLSDYLPKMCERYQRGMLILHSEIVSLNFDLQEEQNRITLLRPLLNSGLKDAAEATRQVVSVDSESKKFLSPRAHVSAAEVKAADLKLQVKRNEMLIKESEAQAKFYCLASDALNEWSGVDAFIQRLNKLSEISVPTPKIDSDLARRVHSLIRLEVEMFKMGFLQSMRLVQAPEEVKFRGTPLDVLGLLGCLLGGLLGSVFVLLRAWWGYSQLEAASSKYLNKFPV